MNGILKMMKHDFSFALSDNVVKAICFPAQVIGILAALFISPIYGAVFIPVGVLLAEASLKINQKPETRKLYGVLPVKRCEIIRASFLEYLLCSLGTELLTGIAAGISKTTNLPEAVYQLLHNGETKGQSFQMDILIVFLIMFSLSALLICFLRMSGEMFGKDTESKILIVFSVLILIGVGALIVLSENGTVPAPDTWRLAKTTGGAVLIFTLMHLAVIGICWLFCEITVKSANKHEL